MRDRVSDRDHNKEIGIRSLEESVKIDVEC